MNSTEYGLAAAEYWYRHLTTAGNIFRDSKLGAALRQLPSGYAEISTAWMRGALLAASMAGWLHQLTAATRGEAILEGHGADLGDDLRARVSSRYAQALVYRGEYDRAGKVSRDALAAAGSADDLVALVDALRARQLACCAPDGIAERAVLASRMLEAADAVGSAWLEMSGRLWRIGHPVGDRSAAERPS
jgi:hypothetical protein